MLYSKFKGRLTKMYYYQKKFMTREICRYDLIKK